MRDITCAYYVRDITCANSVRTGDTTGEGRQRVDEQQQQQQQGREGRAGSEGLATGPASAEPRFVSRYKNAAGRISQ